MKPERIIILLCSITLAGMIGLYLGAWYVWTRYEAQREALRNDPFGVLKDLLN